MLRDMYCHVFRSVTIDGVWIGELDLWTHLYIPLETTLYRPLTHTD
jgi:hypothetical protein